MSQVFYWKPRYDGYSSVSVGIRLPQNVPWFYLSVSSVVVSVVFEVARFWLKSRCAVREVALQQAAPAAVAAAVGAAKGDQQVFFGELDIIPI